MTYIGAKRGMRLFNNLTLKRYFRELDAYAEEEGVPDAA